MHIEYQLAKKIWQELSVSRARRPRLTAGDIEELARQSAPQAGLRWDRTEAEVKRAQAWLAICKLGFATHPRTSDLDDQWHVAIKATAEWMKAAK